MPPFLFLPFAFLCCCCCSSWRAGRSISRRSCSGSCCSSSGGRCRRSRRPALLLGIVLLLEQFASDSVVWRAAQLRASRSGGSRGDREVLGNRATAARSTSGQQLGSFELPRIKAALALRAVLRGARHLILQAGPALAARERRAGLDRREHGLRRASGLLWYVVKFVPNRRFTSSITNRVIRG